MSFEKIEIGWVNMDFAHDRLTAKAFHLGAITLFKLYKDGSITTFHEDMENYETVEREVSEITKSSLLECRNIEVFGGNYDNNPQGFSLNDFMQAWTKSK